jgi:addiction module HigA family antidote
MTQRELAQQIGVSYPRVNELIHGKRGVTPDTALRLAQLFGVEPQFWLNLQMGWDLYQASHSPSARHQTNQAPARAPAIEKACRGGNVGPW